MAMLGSRFDKTEGLIRAVFNRPALWDRRHPQYENLRLRDEMIRDIAVLLGTTGGRVEWEWNQLLTRLKLECLKLQNHYQYSSSSPFMSNWPYFEIMSFLKKQMLSDINKLVDERMNPFDHQPRDERYFMSQRQFTGESNFRRQNQLMYDANFEGNDQFMSVRTAMPQYDSVITPDIPQHHSMNKRRFMPQKSSKNHVYSLSKARNMRKKRQGKLNDSKISQSKTNNISAQSNNEIKKFKVENAKNDNVTSQGKSLVQNSSNLQHGEKVTEAIADKSSKKNESNGGNEIIASDLDFFQSLLPYMKKFPRITKLKVVNKIQKLILDECKNLNKNVEEASSKPAEQVADSLTPVLKPENGDLLQNKDSFKLHSDCDSVEVDNGLPKSCNSEDAGSSVS